MRKHFCLLAMMLSVSALAFSQNTLTVYDFTLPQLGGSMSVQIHLDEEGIYAAYQFDIATPDGIVYPVDADGDVECTLGSGYDSSHNATVHWNEETGLLGVGVISMKTALFKSTGLSLAIPLDKTTVAVGTKLQLTVKNIIIIKQSGEKDVLDDVPFTVTIGEPADIRTVLDETSNKAPEAATGVDVRVLRTINAGEWSTICLPFAMTVEQVKAAFGSDVQLADFTSWSSEEDEDGAIVGINVGFTDVTKMEANHPYIIKVGEKVTEFTVDGVDIDPEDEPVVQVGKKSSERGYMYGTYVKTTIPEENVFLSGNQFWYSTGKTVTKGLRGYFEFHDVLDAYYDETSAASRIKMFFEDETTTGVTEIVNSEWSNSKYYDLQGRRVVKPGKGMYIKNGKKEIIK